MPIASQLLPPGATQVTATSGTVAAANAVATIAAVAGRTNYITGFDISGGGATLGSLVVVTVAGLQGGSIPFTLSVTAGVLLGNPMMSKQFPSPLPASGPNTAITVTCPSLGAGNTNNVSNAYGYYE